MSACMWLYIMHANIEKLGRDEDKAKASAQCMSLIMVACMHTYRWWLETN